ncbi:MAG: hypothetical protein KDA99_07140, partial [Planctomycetales bacterium]|nr:hypothetical protein [Planctomycetales bacterium]
MLRHNAPRTSVTVTLTTACLFVIARQCFGGDDGSYAYVKTIDLSDDTGRQVVVDREPGQYLGHPTTCLLDDGKTILCVYPKGHG